ncbi:MAG: hypothetical protein Q4Q41_00790 [Coriobacteriia bacterium]|nr:hypothetical protein [Coriobacteriia bacterium]
MNSTRYPVASCGASRAAACVGLSLALSLTLTPIALPAHADEPAAGSSSLAAQGVESLSVRGIDTLSVGGDAFDVATAVGLGGATLYANCRSAVRFASVTCGTRTTTRRTRRASSR